MRALVTGGAGFIGSHLADALVEKGHRVVVVDDLSCGLKTNINPRAKFYHLDIRSRKLSSIFSREKPEIVFHLAAQKNVRVSLEDPILDAEINIIGSLNILENCRQYRCKIIFSSSGGAIYGETRIRPTPENHPENPPSAYGVSKLAVDKYLQYYQINFGLPFVSLRCSNVYGPRQDPKGEAGVVAVFLQKILTGQQPIINGTGRQTRDYVFVGDVVEANLKAMGSKKNDIYNIGTGVETSVNELFDKMVRVGKFKVKQKHGPALPNEQMTSCLSCRLAKKNIAWRPRTNLTSGLKMTINWFKGKYEKK